MPVDQILTDCLNHDTGICYFVTIVIESENLFVKVNQIGCLGALTLRGVYERLCHTCSVGYRLVDEPSSVHVGGCHSNTTFVQGNNNLSLHLVLPQRIKTPKCSQNNRTQYFVVLHLLHFTKS